MDSALATALQRPQLRGFFWMVLDIPAGPGGVPAARTVRLVDGDAQLTIDGQVFTGRDSRIGTINSMSAVENGVSSEEAGHTIGFQGWTLDGLADLRRTRGSQVTTGIGVVSEATGLVIGVETIFVGNRETMALQAQAGQESIQVAFASVWSRLLKSNEGHRLNGPYHEQAWPGELGLEWTQGLRNLQTQNGVFIGSTSVGGGGRVTPIGEQSPRNVSEQ